MAQEGLWGVAPTQEYRDDPSGGTMGTREIYPGTKGIRKPGASSFTPQREIWSEQMDRWSEAENMLHTQNANRMTEISNLESLLGYYQGSSDYITRWLIGKSIAKERKRMGDADKAIGEGQMAMMRAENRTEESQYQGNMESYTSDKAAWDKEEARREWRSKSNPYLDPQRPFRDTPELPQGWATSTATGTRGTDYELWENMGTSPTGPSPYDDLGLPDWMGEYMTGGEFGLRPMGAQADLDPEDMGMLQGYMGWTKAGSPTEYSDEYAQSLQSLPNWWEQYTKESQRLFPKGNRGGQANWRTAKQ